MNTQKRNFNDNKILVLDFETSFQIDDNNRKDPSPNDPRNYLVSYGLWHHMPMYSGCASLSLDCNIYTDSGELKQEDSLYYRCFQHNAKETDEDARDLLQNTLDNTDLLVAFNTKFELMWLKACGFNYEGTVLDPMIMAYVLARGQKHQVSLKELCIRYNVTQKKSDLVDDYMKKNIGFEEMPWDIVEEYGTGDIISTKELFEVLVSFLNESPHLWPTVELMCEFSKCLTDIELNGIKIDVTELDRLEEEYTIELNQLKDKLNKITKEVMGATPINLDSPEQLSQVLFSRQVTDKSVWKEIFNLGTELRGSVSKKRRPPRMTTEEFVKYVQAFTKPVYFTTAEQCPECKGKGYIQKVKKDGSDFKKPTRCSNCFSNGIIYIQAKKIAGFRFVPSSSHEVAVGGFSTNTEIIERLKVASEGQAREFLEGLSRINSVSVYLSTFINGIRKGLRNNAILHPSFMQCVTATGRLSSRNPNFQNQPRTNTFPVRKCILSRFGPDGLILSGDAKQLEFRVAGELSDDQQIFKDVLAGIDVHAATAKWTKLSRQDSKPYTFAPVYGATDRGKPDNIAAYYRYFQQHYKGLFTAHREWENRVLETGSFISPSGREFIYPGTVRYPGGKVSNSTILANYPIQSFATADLMIIFCLNTWKLYKLHNLKSLVILEVHDDVTADIYPGELQIAAELMVEAFNSIPQECVERYEYELKMKLEIELKVGVNWMQQKELVL